MLVWMDLEMTGLDHTRDVIVEIATLITDDDLEIVAEGPDLVIHQSDEVLATMDPVVVGMHTKSGLLGAIRESGLTLDDAGEQTLEFIRGHAPEPGVVPLCGNSIGTDRRFLAAYLPDIENHLHYRSVDVSSVKELVNRWYPATWRSRPGKAGTHRALDDIRDSVEELRFYRRAAFQPTTGGVRHVVVFRWADDTTDDQVAAVTAALCELPRRIPEIRDYRVGVDLGVNEGNEQYAVVADFDSVADWRAYATDPRHQEIIAELIKPVLAERHAVQYVIGPAGVVNSPADT
jgi:oligoribonuclease